MSWLVLIMLSTQSAAPVDVDVVVPDPDNLQYLSFWIALGAGFFLDEGVRVAVRPSDTPHEAEELFRSSSAPIAVLPPPLYLKLIGQRVPIVIVANLLQNDPINLVLKREVADRLKVTT